MKTVLFVLALMLVAAGCGGGEGASESATISPTTYPPITAEAAVPAEEVVDDSAGDAEPHEEEAADHSDEDHSDDAVSEDTVGDHADDDHADDDHVSSSAADVDRTVEVAMDEFSFEPGEFEAMAGETIEFVVSNLGVVEHEFRLSNEHRIEEHLAAGHADHDDQAAGGHHEGGDVILLVEPGETGSMIVTFGQDTTLYSEVACLIPGHYEAGMKAPMLLST